MSDFDTAYDRLDCPHSSSCSYQEPMWSVSASTQEDTLTVEVRCNNCRSGDHLMFDVGGYDRSSKTDFDVGDEFTVESSIRGARRANKGDTGKVTAIADNPMYSGTNLVVGVVFGIDSGSPYPVHLFSLDEFKEAVGDEISFD